MRILSYFLGLLIFSEAIVASDFGAGVRPNIPIDCKLEKNDLRKVQIVLNKPNLEVYADSIKVDFLTVRAVCENLRAYTKELGYHLDIDLRPARFMGPFESFDYSKKIERLSDLVAKMHLSVKKQDLNEGLNEFTFTMWNSDYRKRKQTPSLRYWHLAVEKSGNVFTVSIY
ncbi:MAG: hypothetical protein AB8E15_08220 [Bdellovibrionales bacterium]